MEGVPVQAQLGPWVLSIGQFQRRVLLFCFCFSLLLELLTHPGALTQYQQSLPYQAFNTTLWDEAPGRQPFERGSPPPGFLLSTLLIIPDFHRSLEKCHLGQIPFKLFSGFRLKPNSSL